MNYDCIHGELNDTDIDGERVSEEEQENLLSTIIYFFDQQLFLTEESPFEGNEGLLDAQSDLAELYLYVFGETERSEAMFRLMLLEEPDLPSTQADLGNYYKTCL